MAIFRMSILGNEKPDAGVPLDLIANQITEATTPSVGDNLAYVLADGGADEGLRVGFSIPKNYVGTPKIVFRAMLDGTPGAGDDLAFGFRKRAVADNEVVDGTLDAEQTIQDTDISDHADEDLIELSVVLTAGDYVVDDYVVGYAYIDASGTTYVGNILLLDLMFEYTDT